MEQEEKKMETTTQRQSAGGRLSDVINTAAAESGLIDSLQLFDHSYLLTPEKTFKFQGQSITPESKLASRSTQFAHDNEEPKIVKTLKATNLGTEETISLEGLGDKSDASVEDFLLGKARDLKANVAKQREDLLLSAMLGKAGAVEGAPELYDVYDDFNIKRREAQVRLSDPRANIAAEMEAIIEDSERVSSAPYASYLYCLTSQSFFDALIAHPSMKPYYENFNEFRMFKDNKADFEYKNCKFIVYKPELGFKLSIPDGMALIIPGDLKGCLREYIAPIPNSDGTMLYNSRYGVETEHAGDWRVVMKVKSSLLPILLKPHYVTSLTMA